MPNKVTICNMALSHIRVGAIASLGEDSIQAEKCTLFYDSCLKFILSDGSWSFLRSTKLLTLIDETPIDWKYMYVSPNNSLHIKAIIKKDALSDFYLFSGYSADYPYQVDNQETLLHYDEFINPEKQNSFPYRVMNHDGAKVIVTDCSDAVALYTAKLVSAESLSEPFAQALSYYLASFLAMPLIGGQEGRVLRDDSLTMYSSLLASAKTHDISQQSGKDTRG